MSLPAPESALGTVGEAGVDAEAEGEGGEASWTAAASAAVRGRCRANTSMARSNCDRSRRRWTISSSKAAWRAIASRICSARAALAEVASAGGGC